MRIFLAALFAWSLTGAPPEAPAAGLDPERLARIPVRMKQYVEKGELAGVVTLVARHGRVAQLEAAGFQDAETRKPMRTDSIFQVMSMTKPFVATGIMMLVEEGRIALTDPAEKHLPEFRGQWVVSSRDAGGKTLTLKKPARPITVRDLLTHTSGLPSGPPPGLPDLYQKMDRTLAEAVAIYSQQPLDFEPGSEWRYSNAGIGTLGRIIEVAAGMPFEKFLDERIFKPLGMKDSFIFPSPDKVDRIVTVHISEDGKLRRAGGKILGGDSLAYRKGAKYSAPEFGLYTTASDLALFYDALRSGRKLLSRGAVDVMTSLHTGDLKAGHLPGTGFGLAWEVVKEPMGSLALMSKGSYGHGGAFGTHGWVDPKKDLVGVFLIQHNGYWGNAKAVFMAMAASAVVD
jgi:CubicO group peptidase (beta-lactamase class C family)